MVENGFWIFKDNTRQIINIILMQTNLFFQIFFFGTRLPNKSIFFVYISTLR